MRRAARSRFHARPARAGRFRPARRRSVTRALCSPIRPCSREDVRERGLADLLELVGHAERRLVEARSSRRRSIGVPIRTSSASERAIVSRSSSICCAPVAHGRKQRAHVRIRPRTSSRSSRPRTGADRRAPRRRARLAASTAAPYVISPCVSVGPSSTASTRLPRISLRVALDLERRGGADDRAPPGCARGSTRARRRFPPAARCRPC